MADPRLWYRRRGWWRDQTFLDDLRSSARAYPAKKAVVARRVGAGDTRILSYAELELLTDRCAGALVELGVRPGEIVAVQLTNRWELAPLVLGCMRAGARICTLLPAYRRRELEIMLGLTEARVFVTMAEHDGDQLAKLGLALATELPALEHVLAADGPAQAGGRDFSEHFFRVPWEERHAAALAGRQSGPDEPFLVLFTSGTTGEPKGAVHSQNTLYAAIRGEAGVFGLGDDLVMTTASVYTHYTGLVQGMLMPLMLGGTMVFQDSQDGPAMLDLLARHGVTFLYAAPWFLRNLLDAHHATPTDLGRLRFLVSGSAPVPPQLVKEVKDTFGLRLFSLWGMVENGPVTISRPSDPPDWAAHSDGSPISDMQTRIDPMPGQPDGAGLLWVRGPTQCLGYFRRDELYAAQLDTDGWFNTGDLARPDGRGGIRITGRVKEIILHHGDIVPVTEIEAIIQRHPKVREVTLVGLPKGEGEDETICAVVAPVSEPVSLTEIAEHLRAAGTMRLYWPERLELVDALPKTTTGKVRKVQVRERLIESLGGATGGGRP